MTTAEMRECLNQRYKQADAALNQLYQQLLSQLSKTRQIKLREAQQAWVLFRDKSAAFMASAAEGGTMQPLLSLAALTSMTEKRVAELKALLHETSTFR
ncbi:MAG TPA: lysozyme inhibitor LprI family protein [Candidatus Saccharimonadia bacterium]|nr:lysozyme inhibitor LprI family protein [Candidatus Saccharimonadia bacterium]